MAEWIKNFWPVVVGVIAGIWTLFRAVNEHEAKDVARYAAADLRMDDIEHRLTKAEVVTDNYRDEFKYLRNKLDNIENLLRERNT